MITLVFSNHSYFIFSVDFVSEICYNKSTESEVNKMKKTKLRLDHLMTLIEEGRLKVGRYLFKRRVDALGNSYYYRYYRKGEEIVVEEVTPFN